MRPRGLVVVTDRRQTPRPLVTVVAAAVEGGARWVLLREKDLPAAERFSLAVQLRRVLGPVGGRLIVAGPDPLRGDAVHLAAADPLAEQVGAAAASAGVPGRLLVGRSCHDADELHRLTIEDYATVSPIFSSASKPGYGPALGLAGLADLCRRTDRPVLALGGIETAEQAAGCLAAGAAGVAVMGAIMRARDPAAIATTLSAAIEEGKGTQGSTVAPSPS